jgi:hypothetical protein
MQWYLRIGFRFQEEIEDTKGAIRSTKTKKVRQYQCQKKNKKGETMAYKALHEATKNCGCSIRGSCPGTLVTNLVIHLIHPQCE